MDVKPVAGSAAIRGGHAIRAARDVRTRLMKTPRGALLGLLLVASLGAMGCDGDLEEMRAAPLEEVDVAGIAFPPTIEVEPGTSVMWINRDQNVRHTVTSGLPGDDGVPGVGEGKPARPDGRFDGVLAKGLTDFTFTFTEPGTYDYFCRVHPAMYSSVIVIP